MKLIFGFNGMVREFLFLKVGFDVEFIREVL